MFTILQLSSDIIVDCKMVLLLADEQHDLFPCKNLNMLVGISHTVGLKCALQIVIGVDYLRYTIKASLHLHLRKSEVY